MKTTQTNNDNLSEALSYLELGFNLCSLAPNTKKPFLNDWNSEKNLINTKEKAQKAWGEFKDRGIGLVHEMSGTCTLDIDHVEYFSMLINEMGIETSAWKRVEIVSGKNNKSKLLFRIPDSDFDFKKKVINWKDSENGKPVCVFELRAGKVQDVLPPSIHPDTLEEYQWRNRPSRFCDIPELPQELIEIWKNWDAYKTQMLNACPWSDDLVFSPPSKERKFIEDDDNVIKAFNDAHDARSMLELNGYKKIGKRMRAPSSSTRIAGVVFFDDGRFYSHHGSCVFGDGFAHDCFDIFLKLEHNDDISSAIRSAAEMLGIEKKDKADDDLPVIDFDKLSKSDSIKNDEESFAIPEHLLNPPKILNVIKDWQLETARRSQPVFAVNAALSFISTIAAQKVETETGLQTNIYFVSLGGTGSGKEHGRKCIKQLLNAVNRTEHLGSEEIASGQGLLTSVANNPTALFQLDEFGDFMRHVNDDKGGHKRSIITNLMKLFSSAGTILGGTAYADSSNKPSRNIEYPCVNLHATSTQSRFFDNVSSDDALSGYLNRLIICETNNSLPQRNRRAKKKKVPQQVLDWYSDFSTFVSKSAGNLSAKMGDNPHTVEITKDAYSIFDDIADLVDRKIIENEKNGFAALWNRVEEHIFKVSLVLSVACSPSQPVIDAQCAEWSRDYVIFWLNRTITSCKVNINDGIFDKACKQVIEVIKSNPKFGASLRELTQQSRAFRALNGKSMRFDVLSYLEKTGELTRIKRKNTSGRVTQAWVYQKV